MQIPSFVWALFLALVLECVVGETRNFVEEEDGSLSQLNNDPVRGNGRFKWKRCRKESDCGPGYRCRRRWCRPQRMCSVHRHCPTKMYCDRSDGVCKPGVRVCKAHRDCGYYMYCNDGVCAKKQCHWWRHCPYGHTCVKPGLCKLRKGFCKKESHCSSNQCCLRYYGKRYAGVCSRRVRPNGWCDLKGKRTCACQLGYSCVRVKGNWWRNWWRRRWRRQWGKCRRLVIPTTPEPTGEPGSGDMEV